MWRRSPLQVGIPGLEACRNARACCAKYHALGDFPRSFAKTSRTLHAGYTGPKCVRLVQLPVSVARESEPVMPASEQEFESPPPPLFEEERTRHSNLYRKQGHGFIIRIQKACPQISFTDAE
ncbi:hypothetical protein CEXT_604371 [Caerostris extrusa]|uniref:Uncharacterized protein n=1 Tax=Caerostris extrusa TaxID=172846 RepID=A0AAV4RDT5_CAEEX|nr:hypothetical protein CEXT_604371 [Caerostris extrusa]